MIPVPFTRARSLLARYWADAAALIVAGAMVLCIVLEEFTLHASTYAPHADYWEHAGVLRALIDHPWHPSNPHLSISTPSPRFGPLSVALALIARIFRLDALQGLSVAAITFTLGFVVGAWCFFRSYFRDPRAGLYGLLVLLGSWWEAWTFTSVYQPKVLLSVACYPWFGAFAVTLLGLTLTLRVLRVERPRVGDHVGMVLWVAIVFLTHQLTAMMALSALCLLVLTEPDVPLRRRAEVVASAAFACVLCVAWPYYSVWNLLAGGERDAGWVGRGLHAAAESTFVVHRHRFYRLSELVPAVGLGLATVLCFPFFLVRVRRWFVGLGVLSMLGPFAINAFVPLPLGHRFLLLAIFFLHAGVVWLCMVLTPGSAEFPRFMNRRWLRVASWVALWAVLGTFTYHNVQRTQTEWAYFERYARRGESPLIRYARSVADAAGKRSVILADPLTSWPIPAFGPKVVALQHENPFVADTEQRNEEADIFLSPRTTDEQRLALIRRYHVTHVLTKREPRGSARAFLAEHAERTRVWGGYSLFALAGVPN